MAKEEKKLERVYNVPLRSQWLKIPRYKRAKKASAALRAFLSKHMKSDNVKIGRMANLELWKHGIKNPPHHIKVKAVKEADGTVKAELMGFDYKEEKKTAKKEPKGKTEQLKEKFMGRQKPEEKQKEPEKPEKEKETELEKTVSKKPLNESEKAGTSPKEEKQDETKTTPPKNK